MKLTKTVMTLATVAAFTTTSAAMAAEATRAPSALPRASVASVAPVTLRSSKRVSKESNLLGAPLFLAFLGAITITVGFIIINNNNDSAG